MAFRLGRPAITEERCRACRVMSGSAGHTVRAEEAAAFEAACRAHREVWTPRDFDPEPVRAGEVILLEPCVDVKREPCPRVELWPENDLPARLVFAALPSHTRPLLPLFVDALTADLEEGDARSVVRRVVEALQSTAVAQWFASRRAAQSLGGNEE